MRTTDLGKISPVVKGTYKSTSTYEKLDIVQYETTTYIARRSIPKNTYPYETDNEYWMRIFEGVPGPKGDTGARGPRGYQGEKGDPGEWTVEEAEVLMGEAIAKVIERIMDIYPCLPYEVLLAVYVSGETLYLTSDYGEYDSTNVGVILTDVAADNVNFGYNSTQEGLTITVNPVCDIDQINQIKTTLAGKQDALTFDNSPTAGSNNPVRSKGIKTALDAKQDTLTDSGWLELGNANSYYTGTIYYRKVGMFCEVAAQNIQLASVINSGGSRILDTLPEGYRPSQLCNLSLHTTRTNNPVLVIINSSGYIQLFANQNEATPSGVNLHLHAMYTI